MKAILLLITLIVLNLGCGIDTRSDSEKAPELAVMVNNRALEKVLPEIGGTIVIRYNHVFVNEGITDMESRGYVAKQISDNPSSLFTTNATTVLYERRK